ncbi:acyl-CoA dehydrogenase family protein [Actinoplanes philippinensis]
MRLTPSAEQRRFTEVLETLLTRADVPAVASARAAGDPGPLRRLWSSLGDAGVTGLLVPERFGGHEAGVDDLVVVGEMLGRHAVPGPVAESIAAAPTLLASGRRLPELADGRIIASVAAPPSLPFAADGDVADLLLLTDNQVVRLASPGPVRDSLDPSRRLVEALPGEIAEETAPIARALDLGTLACAAQLLGAGEALLSMTVGHARTRTQFGHPIGSFQAIRHQLADVAVALSFARPLLYAAAVALTAPDPAEPTPPVAPTPSRSTIPSPAITPSPATTSGRSPTSAGPATTPGVAPAFLSPSDFAHALLPPAAASRSADSPVERAGAVPGFSGGTARWSTAVPTSAARDVSAAKIACGEAALLAARTALQVHGAIGYTREHDLGRYLTRVRALHLSWGTADWHRRRILTELTTAPPAGHAATKLAQRATAEPTGPTTATPNNPDRGRPTPPKPTPHTTAEPADPTTPATAGPTTPATAGPTTPKTSRPTTAEPAPPATTEHAGLTAAPPNNPDRGRPTSPKPTPHTTAEPADPTTPATAGPTTPKITPPTTAKPAPPATAEHAGHTGTEPGAAAADTY